MKKVTLLITGMLLSTSVMAGGITVDDIKKDPILKGKALAKHCAWCHDINKKLVAPPFKTIMERYKDIPEDQLRKQFFNAIKNGSKGKWSDWMKKNLKVKMGRLDQMYMPPQKPYLNDQEINLVIDWLMTLKK